MSRICLDFSIRGWAQPLSWACWSARARNRHQFLELREEFQISDHAKSTPTTAAHLRSNHKKLRPNLPVYCEVDRIPGSAAITLDANGKGSLNGIDRHDQHAFSIPPNKNAFDAVQCSTTDSHPLSDFEEGVGKSELAVVSRWSEGIQSAHQESGFPTPGTPTRLNTPSTRSAPQAILIGRQQSCEYITSEKRQFNSLFSVAPAMHLGQSWEEAVESTLLKAISNDLFVPATSLQRVPTTLAHGGHWSWCCNLP